jgi:tetratricopeptide (TPR) repeat protein
MTNRRHKTEAALHKLIYPLCHKADELRAERQSAQAEQLYLRALVLTDFLCGRDHRFNAVICNNLAVLYKSVGRFDEAAQLYQRSLVITERARGAEHPDVALTLNNLAVLLKRKGNYAEAAQLYRRALAIFRQSLGPAHPKVITCQNNLARLKLRLAKAKPEIQQPG